MYQMRIKLDENPTYMNIYGNDIYLSSGLTAS